MPSAFCIAMHAGPRLRGRPAGLGAAPALAPARLRRPAAPARPRPLQQPSSFHSAALPLDQLQQEQERQQAELAAGAQPGVVPPPPQQVPPPQQEGPKPYWFSDAAKEQRRRDKHRTVRRRRRCGGAGV